MGFAGAAAVMGGLAIAGTVYQGEKQAGAQKRALRSQEQAQKESASKAMYAEKRAAMESAKANGKSPDTASLLAQEQKRALSGPSSTMLSGQSGVSRSAMKLGQSSLLGG